MQVFHCDHCGQLVFFENVQCVTCGHPLAYLPDLRDLGSLEAGEGDRWHSPLPGARGRTYRLCQNYTIHNVCNWAIPDDDDHQLCASCRLTRTIPNLSVPGANEAWRRLETAKRRLMYTLLSLGLRPKNRNEDPEEGLAFELLADPPPDVAPAPPPILTGHASGVITINVAEADDAERERRRVLLGEPYRTLLGHFRHEIGHYYWDRLVRDTERLAAFRQLFGDERSDYAAALKRLYEQGPPPDWQLRFVTAYASTHPWEDWAETWAHYLHIFDTVETAVACGLALRPRRSDEPYLSPDQRALTRFDRMIQSWFPLTYVLNNLNRGLGLPDAYPFVLSAPVVEKLRFVHNTITGNGH